MRRTRRLLVSLTCRHHHKRAGNVRWFSQALVFSKFGAPEDVLEIQQMNTPVVEDDEVKVKVLAAPINPSDINSIQDTFGTVMTKCLLKCLHVNLLIEKSEQYVFKLGTYPLSPQLPAVGGNEMAGTVTEIGSKVTSLKPGDHVIAAQPGIGTWRDTLVCHNEQLLPVPVELPLHLAATLMVNPATAYRMISDFVELNDGDTIIQNGANSGVGQAVIQLAAYRNINTINIIRNRDDVDKMKEYLTDLGATEVITEEENSKRDIKSLYQRYQPAMLGLNTVGGDSATNLVRQLSDHAVMVTYGGMSRKPVVLPTGSLIFKDIKFVGYWNAKWIERNKNSDKYKQMYNNLSKLGLEGKLRPPKCTPHILSNYRTAVSEAMQSFIGSKQLFVFDQ